MLLQISTLVSLKLLTHTGSAAMFQGVPKYRCNAGYDLVRSLARYGMNRLYGHLN